MWPYQIIRRLGQIASNLIAGIIDYSMTTTHECYYANLLTVLISDYCTIVTELCLCYIFMSHLVHLSPLLLLSPTLPPFLPFSFPLLWLFSYAQHFSLLFVLARSINTDILSPLSPLIFHPFYSDCKHRAHNSMSVCLL